VILFIAGAMTPNHIYIDVFWVVSTAVSATSPYANKDFGLNEKLVVGILKIVYIQ